MNTYWLVVNDLLDCTYIVKPSWFRKIFGRPIHFLTEVEAKDREEAVRKFKAEGFVLGLNYESKSRT